MIDPFEKCNDCKIGRHNGCHGGGCACTDSSHGRNCCNSPLPNCNELQTDTSIRLGIEHGKLTKAIEALEDVECFFANLRYDDSGIREKVEAVKIRLNRVLYDVKG